MRQIVLDCGYSSASIRERLYSRNHEADGGPMAGILPYAAAPDSEGTLGGLVELGDPLSLGRHLKQALEGTCAPVEEFAGYARGNRRVATRLQGRSWSAAEAPPEAPYAAGCVGSFLPIRASWTGRR